MMSEPTLAGNWNDDDGQVIDSLLDENTDGAKTPPPATEPFVPPREHPKKSTRLMGTTATVVAGSVQQLLQADPERLAIHLHMDSVGGLSDRLRYSHDPSLLNSDMMCPSITTTQPVDGVPHTGPLWVMAVTSNAIVSATSVGV
jgi:hypothetical protein